MNLTIYLEKSGRANTLAKAIEVSPVMISLWKTGSRPIPIERCPDIERATKGEVTRRDLRPDDWHRIWPELVDAEHPAPIEKAAA